jgi:serine protease AprX
MTYAVQGLNRIRWGFFAASAIVLSALCALSIQLSAPSVSGASGSAGSGVPVTPKLERLAHSTPSTRVEVIVQLGNDTSPVEGRSLISRFAGRTTGEVELIHGLVARMPAGEAYQLAQQDGVRAVSLNARVKKNSLPDYKLLQTSFNESVQAPVSWVDGFTGKGVGVAVIDTGIAGNLPDFRNSESDTSSRVIASAVTNPYATNAGDSFGHGTHVAGIIAGNGADRDSSDPLDGDYAGTAPDANLISIKASDEQGNATLLDVIYGLQFAVDYKATYNIRVVNLSLESTVAQSYKTDPLDAAVESAWLQGLVVVAAAGNRGTDADAVNYAPGNDPYAISVGAVDDYGSKGLVDDTLATWSSRGTTQDGVAKPEIYAPGAHIVSNLAPNSAFTQMCPACIVDGQYIRAGGTSMAAPVVAGAVANLLQARPGLTPNQVKAIILATDRTAKNGANEVSAMNMERFTGSIAPANQGLTPNTLVNASTGAIDYTRSSWSRSSWSGAAGTLRSSWSRSSWSCNCSKTSNGSISPTRSSWSRSSWSSTTDWRK